MFSSLYNGFELCFFFSPLSHRFLYARHLFSHIWISVVIAVVAVLKKSCTLSTYLHSIFLMHIVHSQSCVGNWNGQMCFYFLYSYHSIRSISLYYCMFRLIESVCLYKSPGFSRLFMRQEQITSLEREKTNLFRKMVIQFFVFFFVVAIHSMKTSWCLHDLI